MKYTLIESCDEWIVNVGDKKRMFTSEKSALGFIDILNFMDSLTEK